MLSLRSRALISAAAFFVAIGLTAALVFLPEHPDEKIISDFHGDPLAAVLGWSLIGVAATIIVFLVLSLSAWLMRRFPSQPSAGALKQLYSPNQALCASLIGGPLAAISLFRANYLTLENPSDARKTVTVGWPLFFIFLAIMLALQYRGFGFKGIGTGIAVGYSSAAKSMMASLQRTKTAILASDQYTFRSNWRVFGIGVLYLATTLFIIFLISLALILAGYHFPK